MNPGSHPSPPKSKRNLNRGFAPLLFLILALPFGAKPVAAQPLHDDPLALLESNLQAGAPLRPGPLLIQLAAEAADPDAHVTKIAHQIGCALSHRVGLRRWFIVHCPETLPTAQWMRLWQKQPTVRWIEADYYEEEDELPDDLDGAQWHHQNFGQIIDGQEGATGADISSADAWSITTGDASRLVAILDSGIDASHEDLVDQIWSNPDEDCNNGVDDDNNGYVDDCAGWDVSAQDNDPSPLTLPELRSDGDACRRWHGTFMAGLVGASGNNGRGVVGVAWKATLLNIKKHPDDSCRSSTLNSVAALAYALDAGAQVLVMSFSSPGQSATMRGLLAEAEALGVVAVMSGGNAGESIDAVPRYPVYYPMRSKLVVTYSDNRDRLTRSSNWGGLRLDLAAPGENVRSTSAGGQERYEARSGSSYAAPLVAGAAVLVWAAQPDLDAVQVTEAIRRGVEPIPGMDCAQTPQCVASGGRLDLVGALEQAQRIAAQGPTQEVPEPIPPRGDAGCQCEVTAARNSGLGWLGLFVIGVVLAALREKSRRMRRGATA